MARVIGFLVIVALAVGGALVLVTERAAVTRSGYRIAKLEGERRRLVEENRRLEARVAQLKTPALIRERARELELRVVPPEERLKEQLKEQEQRQAATQHSQGGASVHGRAGR